MEELLKYLEQDRALGHSAYLFHAEKPEDTGWAVEVSMQHLTIMLLFITKADI